MLDKISQTLTNKIKKEIPDVDDEKAEIINFGLQILLGEVPKIFIMLAISYLLGVFKLTLISFLILLPYRTFSGGFHLKTHIGCIISTCGVYCGVAILSKNIMLDNITKYILIVLIAIFGIIMIKLYAPADTEDVPILSKKVRKQKKIMSYICFIGGLLISSVINNNLISNMIIFGYFIQTIMISRLAYKLTKNKYGHEVYENN